jgi:hypothetical protein
MACKVCNAEKGAVVPFFTETMKNSSTGKTHFIDHNICQPCDKDLRRRVRAVLSQIMPRAHRQTSLLSFS